VCAAACLCVCSPAADKALVVAEHDDAERGRGGCWYGAGFGAQERAGRCLRLCAFAITCVGFINC
jgi:hypothetical protein